MGVKRATKRNVTEFNANVEFHPGADQPARKTGIFPTNRHILLCKLQNKYKYYILLYIVCNPNSVCHYRVKILGYLPKTNIFKMINLIRLSQNIILFCIHQVNRTSRLKRDVSFLIIMSPVVPTNIKRHTISSVFRRWSVISILL